MQNTPPISDAAHEVIRALGLTGGERDPQQEDAGADFDLEIVLEPPASSTPAEPAPPAGSVPALCPVWKRGHCTRQDWCPKRHPRPSPDDGALPAVGHAAARAALRYGVAQGWILVETARGSVNLQEAVDRVAHTGQAEVALPPRTGRGDRRRALRIGAGPGSKHCPRGAPRIPRAARAPTVDYQGVNPSTGVALPHVGGARCHVAPGTRGRPNRHRGGNRPGPPRLAGRPGFPVAQAPGRPPSGARAGGVQPRGNPPAAPRQEGTPLPADWHGPGRPAKLQVALGRRGGATATGPLGPPAVVLTHGHPGPCRPSRQGDLPGVARSRSYPAWPCSTACRRERPGYGGGRMTGARARISP